MAKYLTIEVRIDPALDIYDSATHQSMVEAIEARSDVLSARVVGVSEGPDPEEPGDAAAPDDVATHYDAGTGEVVPTEN